MDSEALLTITRQSRQAVEELLNTAQLRAGDIFVIGCSSSEIVGGHIGKDSSMEAAKAVLDGVLPTLRARGVYLAAQCCEHLNRAIVIEREAADRYATRKSTPSPSPTQGAAGPPTAGRLSGNRCWWRKSAPGQASTSAAP